jgi:hypothetical protein
METTAYDPVAGTGYEQGPARELWHQSMARANFSGSRWTVQGLPVSSGGTGFYWRFFDFHLWFGRVTVESDGFHWSTHEEYDGAVIHEGVTTSLYAAYQSVTQNKPVQPPGASHG